MVLSATKIVSMPWKDFKSLIESDEINHMSYNTLCRTRNGLIKAQAENDGDRTLAKKLKWVETQMQERIKNGVETKRRKPNTGERIVETLVYKDTETNRKLNRVGQTYEKVRYEGAEYETIRKTSMRRRKRKRNSGEDGEQRPKRENRWIACVVEAKRELGAPSFVIVRKEVTDPNSEQQQLEHKVYLKAKELMEAGFGTDQYVPSNKKPKRPKK